MAGLHAMNIKKIKPPPPEKKLFAVYFSLIKATLRSLNLIYVYVHVLLHLNIGAKYFRGLK